jgi:hypothetical protein
MTHRFPSHLPPTVFYRIGLRVLLSTLISGTVIAFLRRTTIEGWLSQISVTNLMIIFTFTYEHYFPILLRIWALIAIGLGVPLVLLAVTAARPPLAVGVRCRLRFLAFTLLASLANVIAGLALSTFINNAFPGLFSIRVRSFPGGNALP